MRKNQIFFNTMKEFIGEEITHIDQIKEFTTSGKQLENICETYFLKKLELTGLKHFSAGEKKEYFLKGCIFTSIAITIFFVIFFSYGKN
jgi:hypothetical protein